jgi:hypothetical protein
MARPAWSACLAVFVLASTVAGSAQVGGKLVRGGNPTPGTPQPEPPSLGDRITLNGCLQSVPQAAPPADDNTPTDSRFVLAGAARVTRVPPGTGGSALAAAASGATYRLEGLDSQFSPFVNTRVEISGEVKPRTSNAPVDQTTLLVEFVQKISSTCK